MKGWRGTLMIHIFQRPRGSRAFEGCEILLFPAAPFLGAVLGRLGVFGFSFCLLYAELFFKLVVVEKPGYNVAGIALVEIDFGIERVPRNNNSLHLKLD